MNWVTVDSSNLDAIGYDSEIETLAVRFQNGQVYAYSHVPAKTVAELLIAPSVGRYFNANVARSFPYVRTK